MSYNEKMSKNDRNGDVPSPPPDVEAKAYQPKVGFETNPLSAPDVGVEAPQPTVSIFEERLDKFETVLEEVMGGTTWTKRGIVAAIVVTIATAITLSLGQWIGPVGVIVVIFVIGVIVIVIFTVILHHQRRSKAPDAPL